MTIHVRLNGIERSFEDGTTVAAMLERLGRPSQGALVERNREVVPHARFAVTTLEGGDVLEVVQLAGGG